jgi:hypothetical protein
MAAKGIPVIEPVRLVSVSGFAVENTQNTQCQFYLVGLDRFGGVWYRRNTDTEWTEDKMERRIELDESKNILGSIEHELDDVKGDLRQLASWVDSVLSGNSPHVEQGSSIYTILQRWKRCAI